VRKGEFYFGESYLSQSARVTGIGEEFDWIVVFDQREVIGTCRAGLKRNRPRLQNWIRHEGSKRKSNNRVGSRFVLGLSGHGYLGYPG
jgi:hypothetical protein